MSILKPLISGLALSIALVISTSASAGLYGFSDINPYTHEEQILETVSPPYDIPNYRALMRNNLRNLISYAKAQNPNFQALLHECDDILYKSLWEYHLEGYQKARKLGTQAEDPSFLIRNTKELPEQYQEDNNISQEFYKLVNGVVYNNLYCSPIKINSSLKDSSIRVISISACPNLKQYDKAVELSAQEHVLFYGFLNVGQAFRYISNQPIINENAKNIFKVSEAQNISFLTDDSRYQSKSDMIADIRNANYDIVVINPLFHTRTPFSPEEVAELKYKKNGARRLIIAMQNVSEAFKKHYYWQKSWNTKLPSWMIRKSFSSPEAYITKYWEQDWQDIIARYTQNIVNSGYDGIFFTGIENHRYFEHQTPLE